MAQFKRLAAVGVILFASVLIHLAQADEIGGIETALEKKDYPELINQADIFLKDHPKNARVRFLKAVALTEQKQWELAKALLVQLNEDFPELAEPYNNLAVIYAAQGNYASAQQALKRALEIDPDYTLAYENLGDIHVHLAIQAYEKANPKQTNSATKQKLSALQLLIKP